jgi:hypothetical protein
MDPNGLFAAEINADYTLGERIGISQTPTIWVVTPKTWVQVTDVSQLYSTIDNLESQVASASTPNSKLRHASTPQK